jgi:hypothetical protein
VVAMGEMVRARAVGRILVARCWFMRSRLRLAWRIVTRHVLVLHDRSL